MCHMRCLLVLAGMAVMCVGCSKSDATSQAGRSAGQLSGTQPGAAAGPAAALQDFLEALRSGNDEKASAMLSDAARQKTAALNRSVTPPASDTAKFVVGKVEYVNDDGAQVACTWTDFDEDGQPKSDMAVWVLRREAAGWRVAGVAAEIFPGEPPLLLNFEDPEDMFRKQQWVREEIRRRAEASELQAQDIETEEKSIRR